MVLDQIRAQVRDVVLNGLIGSKLVPWPIRWWLLRLCGLDVERSHISPGCFFGSRLVRIGRGAFINRECFFEGSAPIELGERCAIGMRVVVATSTHELGPSSRRAQAVRSAPVVIGDGCWIGANATILPGVTIGDGAVIAAGAAVIEDCKPDHLYAGVPARIVRSL